MTSQRTSKVEAGLTTAESIKDIDSKVLFKMYKESKDIHIRNELIHRYMYITEILSKKYVNKGGIDYEDIYQVASLGLIYAIERYDVDRGFEFSSFATPPTIIGEIKKYFRDKGGWSVRVPRRIQELSKKIMWQKVNCSKICNACRKLRILQSIFLVQKNRLLKRWKPHKCIHLSH